MRLKFLQTVSSDSPEYPFRAGQVIVLDRLTREHRTWIAEERAVLLDDPPDDEAMVETAPAPRPKGRTH